MCVYICVYIYIYIYIKLKCSRYRPGVVLRVGRGITLLFHDCGTRRGWVVSSNPRPHFTPRKDPVQEAGWAPGPVWKGGKSRPHRDSTPERPPHSQSLYRLSHPARTHTHTHTYTHTHTHIYIHTHTYGGGGGNRECKAVKPAVRLGSVFKWTPCTQRTCTSTWIWAPVSYTIGYTVPLVNQMQLNELLSFSAPWISLLSSGMWRPDGWYRLNNASEKHDNLVEGYEHCGYRTLTSQLRQEVYPRHR